jgi:hydrogenase expression/formation protein HypC
MCLAVPGKLIDVCEGTEWLRTGTVDFGGVVKDVSLALVPEAAVGDYVLVHVGMALGTIGEDEAQRVFAYLRQLEPEEMP